MAPAPAGPHPARPTDELVLAAVERAARHDARGCPAVPVWTILEHLDVRRRSAVARHVRTRLDALAAAGLLESARRHGVATWALTAAGVRRLRLARRAGRQPVLSESPQHRAWRAARTAAAQEIERFRERVRERLHEACSLLDASVPADSDAWLELAEQLHAACRRLASASYCLYEWDEPDDARADIDELLAADDELLEPSERARRRSRRRGRRNVRLWQETAGE